MFTSAEAQELRAYYSRYPFDSESNVWLPHALLMAEIRNKFAGSNAQLASAKDFMPFARVAEQDPEDDGEPQEPRPYTKKHLKRIAKAIS